MKLNKTFQYKIISPNKGKALSLNKTVRQYRKCVNFYLHEMAKGTELKEIYQEARETYGLPSALVQTARDFAKEQLKSYEENEDNPHFPHFDGFVPVRYDKRTISFKKVDNHFEVWGNIATVDDRVRVPITSDTERLERLEGGFKSVQLLFDGDDFYLNVVFEEEREISNEEDFERFVGVDLGIENIATVVVQDKSGEILDSELFSGGELQEKRRRFKELRKSLGERKLWSEVKETKNDESNYIRDMNHKISRAIVDMAEKYDAQVIVMEKLDGIREHIDWSKEMNWKLHNWAFRQLQDFIEYKAHSESIAVRRVYPQYTSRVCMDCLGKIERVSQSKAVCQSCKKEYNADFLGAVNVTRRLFGYMSDGLGDSGYRPEQGGEEPEGDTCSTFGESQRIVPQLRVSQP